MIGPHLLRLAETEEVNNSSLRFQLVAHARFGVAQHGVKKYIGFGDHLVAALLRSGQQQLSRPNTMIIRRAPVHAEAQPHGFVNLAPERAHAEQLGGQHHALG